jgi:sugar-specific transcriptional regulator TrmB
MADFLDDKKREIAERLKELRPLVDEYQRLEAAQRALEGVPGDGRSSARTATPRRRSSAGTASRSGGRGRPRGSGTRSKQALKLVQDNPGITISELADKMGIKQNYLYRVLPGLEQDGLVRKEGRGWHPQAAA